MTELLTEIQTFCAEHGLSDTRFGELAMNDKPFVAQLKAGRRTWPETADKVRNFMKRYVPDQQDAA